MRSLILIILLCHVALLQAQDYTIFHRTVRLFYKVASLPTAEAKAARLEALVDSLVAKDQFPIKQRDSVAFIYIGDATSVEWIGDFNGWGYFKEFKNEGTRIKGTDVWILKASFPDDARLDYKIVTDKRNWILDPHNPHHQWSGVGGGSPNSELRMPRYLDDPVHESRPSVAKGKIIQDKLYTSKKLGYQLTYSVYLPAVEGNGKFPVAYVTDGYEYIHPKLGNMPTVLDNLIADKKIKPVMAVFIDHREPANRTNNRRMQELVMNKDYLDFFVNEFIPFIESEYPAKTEAINRAVVGSSVGGLNATFFAFSRPDVFGNAGIQSPSFFTRPQIYSLCDSSTGSKVKISMTSGLINDASDGGRKMIKILESNACVYQYREVNQGHSWGNWRYLIDDILIDFFAPTQ